MACDGSIEARYYLVLKDTDGVRVALFDDWRALEFTQEVNEVGTYSLTISALDDRISLFDTDYFLEVWRSVPGRCVDEYMEFFGMHRKETTSVEESGDQIFTSVGVTPNDLLKRRVIGYLEGTIYSDKENPAETVMKEYVNENCGSIATMANTRLLDGVFQNFYVDADAGEGVTWSGVRAFENLLDTLKSISEFSSVDFEVQPTGDNSFIFKTFVDQLGADRTTVGLDPSTGLNAAGNVPAIFSVDLGVLSSATISIDHLGEANAVIVLGEGDGATRDTIVRLSAGAAGSSPWNSCEVSRNGAAQEFDYQREDLGDEVLAELAAKEEVEVVPMQRPGLLYGRDYALGDMVTIRVGSIERNKRIMSVNIRVQDGREEIYLTMKDVA